MPTSRVQLRPGSLYIDGRPVILFSSSLFYFRLPAAEWRGRMQSLARLGYNAIDVYFPWNYHELAPGVWDFRGERDVTEFLHLAQQEGLWVVARPGPYICSEWDGGALPAFLNLDPTLRLRDANPAYLSAARAWYDRILPLLAPFQVDRGGPLVMLQVENELDFYDCHDRAGMMSALRDSALEHGMTVPLIACAGQGDLPGATGGVEGVAPTCNVYFQSIDPYIEERVRQYAHLLAGQGLPLCVIETNRAHADLRRLIAAGAKLVGPYLQAGGTDFGFTTGVTNWGSPLSLMTSHYDFGGMLSPGGRVRPEGLEARRLTAMLDALGPAAALSRPLDAPPLAVQGAVSPSALALEGGGYLLALANPGPEPAPVTLGEGPQGFPRHAALAVAPDTCPFVLLDFPLSDWGVDGALRWSTAELVGRRDLPDGLELRFFAPAACELSLRLPGASLGSLDGWQAEQSADTLTLWTLQPGSAAAELRLPGGRRLVLRAVDLETACGFTLEGLNAARVIPPPALAWQSAPLDPTGPDWFASARACAEGRLRLEENGIYRGMACYAAPVPAVACQGLLLRSGADILSIYAGSRYLGSAVPGGSDAFVPLPAGFAFTSGEQLSVRAEIWGHANFDDNRLPALRLSALRGMAGLAAVTRVTNLAPNWSYQDGTQEPAGQIDPLWPRLYFGGWSTVREPAQGVYHRPVGFAPGCDARVLHFPDIQVTAKVYLDGRLAGEVSPFAPFVDLSAAPAGQTCRLSVAVDQRLRRPLGMPMLYEGQSVRGWSVTGWDEARLAGRLPEARQSAKPAHLPFRLEPGQMAWLSTHVPLSPEAEPAWDLLLDGQGLKITAFLGQRIVGRVWLPSPLRPRMAGGPPDRAYLPPTWIREANGALTLLVECLGEEPGEITKAGLVVEE